MPFRGDHDHQPAEGFGEGDHAPVWAKLVQAAPAASAAGGAGVGVGWDERHWQVDGAQDFGWEGKAEPRAVRVAAGLAGDSRLFPGLRVAEFPDAHIGGRPQGDDQAAVRGSHPEGGAGRGWRRDRRQERARGEGGAAGGSAARGFGSARGFAALGRGAPAIHHRGGGGAKVGHLHVRRAELLPRRQAAPQGGQGDPVAPRDGHLRRGGRARPLRPRLPLRLRVLPLRQARGVRRGHAPLQRAGRDQHLPRRLRPDRKLAIPRGGAHLQGGGTGGRQGGREEVCALLLPRARQDARRVPAHRGDGRLYRLGNYRHARRKRHRKNNLHPPPRRTHQAGR
mmetsp:Transcript_6385/g.21358  ORF Transcript_6385/g.21358 Transcript_6385/m.21358 type:complete len:338 (+) Transcript_6385:300-1313(+)